MLDAKKIKMSRTLKWIGQGQTENDRIPVQMPRIRKDAAERQPLCSQDVSTTRLDGGLDTTFQVTSK